MVILSPGMYTVDSAVRRSCRPPNRAADAQRGRGDMHADAPVAVGQLVHRERIVDFRGGRVIDAEGVHVGQRQFVRCAQLDGREAGAMREMLEQEALQMVILRGGQCAAALQQMCGGQMRRCAGRFQRLDFEGVAIRFVEQLRQMCSANSAGNSKRLSCSV